MSIGIQPFSILGPMTDKQLVSELCRQLVQKWEREQERRASKALIRGVVVQMRDRHRKLLERGGRKSGDERRALVKVVEKLKVDNWRNEPKLVEPAQ